MWRLLFLGLILTLDRGESRAVNISNTWTLPQEGFNVFYRFFRDKISWFEADAVCQFHHANLVTVDNGVQFDAARNFLQILDVTQPVWIGLMRPQNAEVFAWSNSKPLASSSGYWAESLPLMESPLCAVIDPVRDFRWHALRCGGPETASFLCEMNAPNWAKECIPEGIPSLTIQYMADSGSVELSKDCADEGIIHRICRSKQDLNQIIKELVCKNEHKPEVKENLLMSKDLINTHFKSMEIIKNVSSDNDEDNNISTQPKSSDNEKKKVIEKNPVQKLIEQFNVEEIMQADQPQQDHKMAADDNDEEKMKTPKKNMKKAKAFEKKTEIAKKMKTKEMKLKSKEVPLDEMMMGDQPVLEIDESQEPLPHIKKSLSQDLKHHYTTVETDAPVKTTAVENTVESASTTYEITSSTTISTMATTLSPPDTRTGSVGHPMHSQQSRGGIASASVSEEEAKHAAAVAAKEINDNHFIPPMLLVKSHYTSTKSHLDEQGIITSSSGEKIELTTQHTESALDESKTISTTVSEGATTSKSSITIPTSISSTSSNNLFHQTVSTIEPISSTTIQTSSPQSTLSTAEHEIAEIKFKDNENQATFTITTRPFPIDTETMTTTTTTTTTTNPTPTTVKPINNEEHNQHSIPMLQFQQNNNNLQHLDNEHQSQPNNTQQQPQHQEYQEQQHELQHPHHPQHHQLHESSTPTTSSSAINANNNNHHHYHQEGKSDFSKEEQQHINTKPKNKFSNEENFQPYKPNRKRSLIKPATTTYLKKILG